MSLNESNPAAAMPASASELLKARKTTQLMDDYREARRVGTLDAHEARRWITVELIDRLGRPAVVAFERRLENEAKERTIEASEARKGDIYVTREDSLYDRREITTVSPRLGGALVSVTLSDHTVRMLNVEEAIVVERDDLDPDAR